MASEVIFTEFVVTRVLHTARISNVESTVCDNEERKMVNFKLGKEMRKMEYSVCHERGTKKRSESPTGIEPMTTRTPIFFAQTLMITCVCTDQSLE